MSAQLVYLRPKRVAASRATGPAELAASAAWASIVDWLDHADAPFPTGHAFGLLYAAELPGAVTYDACVEVQPQLLEHLPPGVRHETIAGGSYVSERVVGLTAIDHAMARLRADWPASSHLGLDIQRPIMLVFQDDPAKVPAHARVVDVCVPLVASLREDQVAVV